MSTDYYKVCDACVAHAVHYHRAEPETLVAHTGFDGKGIVLDVRTEDFFRELQFIDDTGHIVGAYDLFKRSYRSTGKNIDTQDRVRTTLQNWESHSDTW